MAKRINTGERLKSTVVQAFKMLRPFEKEFREQVDVIQAKSIRLAEITTGVDFVRENVHQLAADLLASAKSLDALMEKQMEAVAELGVSSMKLKEIQDDPREIGEHLIDVSVILANWDELVRQDISLLVTALQSAYEPTRREALKRLPASVLDEWLDAILDIKNDEAQCAIE